MKSALLIIDIQNDYFPGGKMELQGSPEASLAAQRVLTHFREKELPLIHGQHISPRPGATFFLPGTEGVEIHENVKAEIVHQFAQCFGGGRMFGANLLDQQMGFFGFRRFSYLVQAGQPFRRHFS